MAEQEDFQRVGNLLGEACEAAAEPLPSDEGGRLRGQTGHPGDSGARGSSPRPRASSGQRSSAGAGTADPARLLALAWPHVVGVDVAANARPAQLRGGRLVVSTSSSEWAHTLQYMEEDLKARLNERLGSRSIDQISFRHAGWEERPRREEAAPPSAARAERAGLSAEQKQALARLDDLGLPPEVKQQIARAMKAAFVRGQQDSVR
jgi:predicted nucleic acid-binding Zn ribbon protein